MKIAHILLVSILFGLFVLSGCSENLPQSQLNPTIQMTSSIQPDVNLNNPTATGKLSISATLLSTLTPEPPPTSPTPTLIPQVTLTPVTSAFLIKMVSSRPRNHDEQSIFAHIEDDGSYISFDPKTPSTSNLDFPLTDNLGKAARLGFANFIDILAYMDFENNFWIADLTNQYRVLIYTDQSKQLPIVELTWTPDDLHLILSFESPDKPDLIFHLLTDEIDEWNFTCDRLALSPHTKQVATWCKSSSDSDQFAVIEWGGEIWYSDTPPINELLHAEVEFNQDSRFNIFPLYRNVGWSSDGTEIAFFDPQNSNGELRIVNSQGEIQKQILGIAYWLSELDKNRGYLPGMPIQWSKNDKRILIFAVGSSESPCPEVVIDTGPLEGKYTNPACWQVIDLETEDIVWQLSDLTSKESNNRLSQFHTYEEPTISPNGKLLAIYSFAAADMKLYIINVETGEILQNPPFRVLKISWGPK